MAKWMMIIIITIVIIAGIVGNISARTMMSRDSNNDDTSRPAYVGCQSSLECMPGHCCAIGPNRFSIPACKPMQEEGAHCRSMISNDDSSLTTINTTLVYPDGTQLNLTNVYHIFCPCVYGFQCDNEESICRDPSQKRGFNHLLGEASTPDD